MVATAILPERWEKIIHLLEAHGGATVEQIGQALGISDATVRRDLARIEQRGLIVRTRGGATALQHVRVGMTISESRHINPKEKERIGREAAKLIQDGETVILDGGFTTYHVARHLSAQEVSVITNSIDVVQALFPKNGTRIILVGGEVSRTTGTTVGPQTDIQLSQLQASKAILGADALSLEAGLCSPYSQTAQTKRTMVSCARELIVVADHTKLGKYATYKASPLESVSRLVTDSEADPDVLEAFGREGIEIIVADMNGSES